MRTAGGERSERKPEPTGSDQAVWVGSAHVDSFQAQELDLALETTRKASQAAISSNDPVTGDHDGKRI